MVEGGGFVSRRNEGTLLALRVYPDARKSAIEGTYGENALKVRVAAPPVDGKANDELCRFLAGVLGIPRSRIEVVRGASGRDKVVRIRDAEPDEVLGALYSHTA